MKSVFIRLAAAIMLLTSNSIIAAKSAESEIQSNHSKESVIKEYEKALIELDGRKPKTEQIEISKHFDKHWFDHCDESNPEPGINGRLVRHCKKYLSP